MQRNVSYDKIVVSETFYALKWILFQLIMLLIITSTEKKCNILLKMCKMTNKNEFSY